ncbi:hypothetical protein UlMin_035090 [Ulmus minor]
MPKYAKFLKEVLSNKRRLEGNEKVMLTEECSAILQRKLPQKLKDPGSFTIPCTIGDFEFDKVLCDLGASINLMPLSIFRKLGFGEVKPTTVTLQLADRSIKHPRGIIEDVLVKVDKFIFPADFIVLDMEEDREVPLILGRPFLATGRTLIDVHQGKLILRVQDEQVTFNVFEAMKFPSNVSSCFEINYSIPNVGISSIQRPPIQANNFEIKPAIIQMIQNSVQFGGLPNDDPNLHIANFLEICDTFKHNGVTDDAVRLRFKICKNEERHHKLLPA